MFEFLSFLFFSFFAGVGAEGSSFFLSLAFFFEITHGNKRASGLPFLLNLCHKCPYFLKIYDEFLESQPTVRQYVSDKQRNGGVS